MHPVALDIHRAVWNTLYVTSIVGCRQLTADNWPGTSLPGTCRPSLAVHNLVTEQCSHQPYSQALLGSAGQFST